MEAGITAPVASRLTKGLGSRSPTSLTALQRKRGEEAQAKPSAQAAVSEPCLRLKDIEVSRGCDYLSRYPKSPNARGGGAHVLTLLFCSTSVCAEVDGASVSEHP